MKCLYILSLEFIRSFYQSANKKIKIGKPVVTQKLEKLPRFMNYQFFRKYVLILFSYLLIIKVIASKTVISWLREVSTENVTSVTLYWILNLMCLRYFVRKRSKIVLAL